ncbi:MAG: winged helix-turn-helix domain-containing protein [Candidatus Methanofastidiosia archaeon]
MHDIAKEEIERMKILEAIDQNKSMTVPEISEATGIDKLRLWRHILSLTQKLVLETAGEKDNYMIYQRRG